MGARAGAFSPTPDAEQLRTGPLRGSPLEPSRARPEPRGAHEPGTPNLRPRDPTPKPRPATYGSISEPRALGRRRRVPSPPGVPQPPQQEPPARPSSRPRKTHQSATRGHVRGSGGPAGRSGLQQHSRWTPVTWAIGVDSRGSGLKITEEYDPRDPVQVPRHSSWLLPLSFISESGGKYLRNY